MEIIWKVIEEDLPVLMDAIEEFVKESGAQFWIQHDKEQNATIKHSPEFYM